ncbi:MAG TPA: TolC family protein [Phaeodactylibacter sp.]|nr:TolC family protein [Phaeodactylibacter sp.]
MFLKNLQMQNLQKGLLAFLISLISFTCFSQKVNFDKVVTPPEMGTRNFKEYLVQLAWINSPENEALTHEQKLREFEFSKEKKDWMDDVRFSVNLNETHFSRDTIQLSSGGSETAAPITNLFPIFNLHASVKLSTFTNRKNKLGIAEQRIKIAEANVNQKKLKVRMEILKRYEEYQMQEEILKSATQAEEDSYQAYILITDLFKADRAEFKDYTSAATTYHAAVQKRIKATADLNIAQLKIEEMIGISFPEAKKMRK